MKNTKPTTFYRYFDIVGAIATIKTMQIRWAHHSTFNDPFDCNISNIPIDDNLSDQDVIRYYSLMSSQIKSDVKRMGSERLTKEVVSNLRTSMISSLKNEIPKVMLNFHADNQNVLNNYYTLCLSRELENILVGTLHKRTHWCRN